MEIEKSAKIKLDSLEERAQKAFYYFVGKYKPIEGQEDPPKGERNPKFVNKEKAKLDESEFLPIAGFPHPKYKIFFQGFREDGSQRWSKEKKVKGTTIPSFTRESLVKGGLKWCPSCETLKLGEDFHASQKRPDGLSSKCKACSSKSSKEYEKSGKAKETRKKYRENNKEKWSEFRQNWVENNEALYKLHFEKSKEFASREYSVDLVKDEMSEKALERFEQINSFEKLKFCFYAGWYKPENGNEPPPIDDNDQLQHSKMQTGNFVPISGFPHPKYKGIFYGYHTNNLQMWRKKSDVKNKKLPDSVSEEFIRVGLKWCSICEKLKLSDSFNASRSRKDGLATRCKKCRRETRNWKEYYENGGKEVAKKWQEKNKEKMREANRVWRENNKDKMKGYVDKWKKENPEKWREAQKKSHDRRKKIPLYYLHTRIRNNIYRGMEKLNSRKVDLSKEYLGCSIKSFAEKYYSLKKDESYEDYWEEYDIDHIIPSSVYTEIADRELMNETELERLIFALWHHSNLQPLNWEINQRVKRDKIDGVRTVDMEDRNLLNVAWNLIERTENQRKVDAKNPAPS